MTRRRIVSCRPAITATEDYNFNVDDSEGIQNSLDNVEDTLNNVQDIVEDLYDGPHNTVFDIENNISNHYIAECERCHEVFISAVVESETSTESVEGECPICHETSKQYLKWIIREAENKDTE